MMPNVEPAVAGELCYSPARTVPVAWAWLRPEDFTDYRCRAVFEAAVAGWEYVEESGQHIDSKAGAAWLAFLEVAVATRLEGSRQDALDAIGYVMDHSEPWCPPERYERLCHYLAAAGSLRRMREVLTRWGMAFTRLATETPGGSDFAIDVLLAYDSDEAGQRAAAESFPRILDRGYRLVGRPLEPGTDAAACFVALRAELDDAMRSAVRAPGREAARDLVPAIRDW